MTQRFREMRSELPRLYTSPDDPNFLLPAPSDPVRTAILANIISDCELMASQRPWKSIPLVPDSTHPFHQLYITFYSAMHASALIEQYSFAWRLTGDKRWLRRAKRWLLAATQWEHSDAVEEHFYSSNRYMHAFAVALDWLAEELRPTEEQAVVDCLVGLMQRWWPEVNANRHSQLPGHHTVVDNGHFGVAAIQLLGRHPDAPEWVSAVVDRFRAAVMPLGCSKDGAPVDGPSFWNAENLWMLHFVDSLRNVTGVDLAAEFPRRMRAPLKWLRYQLAPADPVPEDGTVLLEGLRNQLHECSAVLLRLAQEAGDAELRSLALKDSRMGKLYFYRMGVKGTSAECIVCAGPYAYVYYDPEFRGRPRPRALPPSRAFRSPNGDSAILRSCWGTEALVAKLSAWGGGSAHSFSDLRLQWAGYPALRSIPCAEASPVQCGNLPSVGGQNEFIARMGPVRPGSEFDRVQLQSPRLRQEYWLLRGAPPALLVALRRGPRGVRVMGGRKGAYVRVDNGDYLQYPADPFFSPEQGELALRVRLAERVDPVRPQILFGLGMSIPEAAIGTAVNSFMLGLHGDRGLVFSVQSQRYTHVAARIAPETEAVEPGVWHDIVIRWGGLNRVGAAPFIELSLDDKTARCDDPAVFGELGADSQGLHSRSTPRTFIVKPNTVMAFGSAPQLYGVSVRCDFSRIELTDKRGRTWRPELVEGLPGETGSDPIVWKLNPVALQSCESESAELRAGPRSLTVRAINQGGADFALEQVPHSPAGLAAGSLRSTTGEPIGPAQRLLIQSRDDDLLLGLIADSEATVKVDRSEGGLTLSWGGARHAFGLSAGARHILERR